jgi:hypothetical protein
LEPKETSQVFLASGDLSKVETSVITQTPDPVHTSLRLHFASDLKKAGGPGGKNLNLEVRVPQLVTLLSYVSKATKSAPSGVSADAEPKMSAK